MGLGKTYSADYLIDSNGNTGVSGQVLISTATGIDWADGAAITGGPFLPLAGGRITGTNKIEFNNGTQFIQASDGVDLKLGASDDIILETNYVRYQAGSEYARISGSANSWIASPSTSKLGVGTTSPQKKLDVYLGTDSAVASVAGTISAGEYAGLHFGYSEAGNSNYRHSAIVFERDDASHGDARGKIHILNSASGSASADLGDSRLTILPSGNVGIGTTSPGAKLQIGSATYAPNSNLSNNLLQIKSPSGFAYLTIGNGDTANATSYIGGASGFTVIGSVTDAGALSEHARITNTGNVGIGTTSPGTALQVGGLDDGSNYDITLGWNAVDSEAVGTKRSAITFKTGQTSVNTEDIYKWDIAMLAAPATVTNEEFGSDLAFLRSTRGSTATDATTMILTRTGNVGIGTTNPSSLLHLSSNNSTYESNGILSVSGGVNAVFNSTERFIFNIDSDNTQTDRTFDIAANRTGSSGGNLLFRVQENGNVGIGSTDPTSRLSIKGTQAAIDITRGNTGDSKWEFSSDSTALYFSEMSTGTRAYMMTIKETSGNVGIGETDPKAKLNITGVSGGPTVPVASSSDGIVRIESSNGGVGLDIGAQGASPYSMWMQVGNTSNSSGDTYPILLNPLGGNVGVGTTNPTTKLYVDGGESTFNRGNSAGAIARFRGSNAEKAVIGTVDSWFASNVGIGTTSPGRPLTVNSDSAHKAIRILENDSGNESWDIGVDVDGHLNFFNSADTSPSVTFLDNGNVGIGTNPVQTLEIHDSDASGYTHFGIKGTGHKYVIGVGNDSVADVNDKLYFYDNDNSAFRLALDTSGNVGIGTTSPGAKLDIHTATNTNGLLIREDSDDSITHNFYIDSSDNGVGVLYANGQSAKIQLNTAGNSYFNGGNVGIGTTAPGTNLHIEDSNPFLTLRGNSAAYSNAGIQLISGHASNDRALGIFHYVENSDVEWFAGLPYSGNDEYVINRNTGYTVPSSQSSPAGIGASAGRLLTVKSSGNVGIGTTNPSEKLHLSESTSNSYATFRLQGSNRGGIIDMYQGAYPVSRYLTDQSGNIGIYTSGAFGSTTLTEKVSITTTGNVGIGTSSPDSKLDVSGGDITVNTTGIGFMNFKYNTNSLGSIQTDGIDLKINATSDLLLLPGSNVGIGTTSPTHKLHVNGNMRLTGALRDSNNATGSAGQVLSSTGSATDWISLPASSTVYTPKVYNLNNSTNINSQGQKLVPDFGTLEIEGNTTVEQVSGSDTDFQVSGEGAGIYEVTYAVFYKNTSNQRTPLGTYLTLNGTAVNGSLMVNYLRADVTGGGNWSSCTNTFYVNVTDASHPMALCVRRADSSTAPSGISMVEPAGMAVKSTISFRRIS